jgi:hypothetical protein
MISEKHRQVWQAIHAFIRNRGGSVISTVDASPIKFQVTAGSTLPAELAKLKYAVRSIGTTTAPMPTTEMIAQPGRPRSEKVARDQVGLASLDIFEVDMPLIR